MSGMTRAERLTEMKWRYIQRAYSDIELAGLLGTRRETIFRDRKELESQYPFIQDDRGRWKIDRSRFISEIKVNLHEALTLYLSARKVSRQTRFYHPHAASAVEKLAAVLRQPMTGRLLKTADRLLQQQKDPERIKILETLTQAWVDQYKVRIRYQGLKSIGITNHVISPYLIEPSIWSDSVYLVGYSDTFEKIMPFKVDRIQTAALSGEPFEVPETFDDQELLKYAWGIWYGDAEPVTVKLRFSPAVTKRVKESIWHPLETIIDTEGGGCIWSAEVAEWHEMLPWVRGWGADVEVLEPEELRIEIIQHIRDLAAQYKISTDQIPSYMTLWAKTDRQDQNKIHRLTYHMIDVGQVALAMWNKAIDIESKHRFSEWLHCNEDTAGRTLAFLISLHDLGKASPAFQIKAKTMIGEISKAGFWLPKGKPLRSSPHGIVSTWALRMLLQENLNLSKNTAKQIAQALGGHHGTWPTPAQWLPPQMTSDDTGNDGWELARKDLTLAMMEVFKPLLGFALPQGQQEINAFLALFSGFTSVADWIGSMTEFFPYEKRTNIPLETYASRSAENAEKALSKLGWFDWHADGKTLTFKEMFPLIDLPNSVQQRIIDEVAKTPRPALIILESPTGSGKTEAALYAADTWLQSQRGRGIYVAMPTQATSNQMHDRVTKFLAQRYPKEIVNIHLVHGSALLEESKAQTEGIYDQDQNESQGAVRAEAWFLPRKRTLLAPFGVGTVDQALMSVLQTRHFFVRLFGLQNKIVIFDEVHAYDTYMSELFKQLLAWLRWIGVSVILLSATLPGETRRELVGAYLGKEVDLPPTEYPRLTIASAEEEPNSIFLESPSSRTLQLESCDTDSKTIVGKLRTALQNGGCAAVICNRVQRAQDLYKEIRAAELVPEDDLILFHARFPFQWRKDIEDNVLAKFGKDSSGGRSLNRPQKSIIVATQVLEQSLDLDFDYMVSDLAPIDLLIQRAGRLHRHKQNNPLRAENLKAPTMLLAFPQADEIPDFEKDEYVYSRSVMLRTWLLLREKTEMNLPQETTALIEAVYGDELKISDELLQKEVEKAIEKAAKEERDAIFKAVTQLIGLPGEDDLLSQRNNNLDEDDPTVNQAFRAMTRDAEPNVSLICLHRVSGNLCLDPENSSDSLNVFVKPDKDLIRKLLRGSINLQSFDVVKHFSEHEPELKWKEWKEVAALKYMIPIVFEDGECKLNGTQYTLILDRHMGLSIQKEDR